MRSYKEMIERRKKEFGDKFDDSDLNPSFVEAYESQNRVTVEFDNGIPAGIKGTTKRGTIGVTTGWRPCFLLMLTKRSIGSSWTIGKYDKVVQG